MAAKYRQNLPQMDGSLFLTDGGIETTLIFHDGFDLPLFAAFDLLKSVEGREALTRYYSTYAKIAQKNELGFVLESATWRASPDWGEQLGYSIADIRRMNQDAIDLLVDVRNRYETDNAKMPISGCMGSRGDGYNPGTMMTQTEAEQYHRQQIEMLAETDADMVTALTMTYLDEAIGLTRAAQANRMPAVISFTLETDGKLPSGVSLKDAIEGVDEATGNGPEYYMINCAHPTHFEHVLQSGEVWTNRLRGLRANASSKSHEELDASEELDEGDPVQLGDQYGALIKRLPNLNVLGGCCGTDHRHIEAICGVALEQR